MRPSLTPFRGAVLLLTVAHLGCHGPGAARRPDAPPTAAAAPAGPPLSPTAGPTLSPEAARAWSAWLAGRAEPVAGDEPARALLRARLALDALRPDLALPDAILTYKNAHPGSPLSILGWRLAEAASQALPDGAARLSAALGATARPGVPSGARHTVRISFLPFLDTRRLLTAPPRLTSPEAATALGSTWALSEPAAGSPRPDADGLVLSAYTLPPGPAVLEIRGAGRLVAFRADRPIAATAPDRPPPETVRVPTDGAGPLLLVWASDEVPRLTLWPLPPPAQAPGDADRLFAALLALEDEDREAVQAALGDAADSPATALLRAEAAATDPSIPAGRTRDARRAAWEAVVDTPAFRARARLELGRLARRGGDLEAARRFLTAAAEVAPESEAVARETFQVYYGLGWNDEASAALDRAERLAARPCDLLDDRVALQGARGNTAGRLRLVEPLAGCGRAREAAELLLDLDRPAEALARLDALPANERGARFGETRRRALVALGRLPEAAESARAEARTAKPTEVGPALAAADLGAPADLPAALRAIMARHATTREAKEMLLLTPEDSLFGPLLQDTEATIAAYEADARAQPDLYVGPAVQVLDHSATQYFDFGKRLRLVHEILAIRTREAAQEFGEVTLPDEARAVAVFNRKADGRRLYAEDDLDVAAAKDSLSLPDVAIGDYVVAIYIDPGDNGYLYDSGFLTPRVFYQGGDLPVFRRLTEILAPAGPKAEPPLAQGWLGAPAATPFALGEGAERRAGLRALAERVPQAPTEDDSVPDALSLPSARFGRGVRLDEDLDFTRDRLLGRRQRNPEFDAWALATAGAGDDGARAARLARAVRERIDGQTGLLADDAPRMWESGHGHRALVFSVALEAAGIGHSLLLARPRLHAPSEPFTQVFDFPYALIRLDAPGPGGRPQMFDPGPDRAEPGFVPFGFLGGDALQVWPPPAGRGPVAEGGESGPDKATLTLALPRVREVEDTRRTSLALRLAADGSMEGDVDDVLSGQEAVVVGAYLARLEPAQRPKVMERLLSGVMGAATVDRFDDPVVRGDAPDGPLRLCYHFTARLPAGARTLELGLFPTSPGHAYASRAERRTALMIELPTDQQVSVTIDGPPGLTAQAGDAELRHGGHRAARRISADREGHVRIRSQIVVAGGDIAPAAYTAFARWAHAAEPLERVLLTLPAP